MADGSEDGRVVVADTLRPRGNKGELLARSQTDVPGRLENLGRVQVRLPDGSDVWMEVESSWPFKEDWVFKFAGVDSISEAERFSGAELWVDKTDRGQLPDGQYFQSDLMNCLVVDRQTGAPIGPVTGWQHYGASPLLEVEFSGRTVLIPLVAEICPVVDIPGKRILAELPEGLLEL